MIDPPIHRSTDPPIHRAEVRCIALRRVRELAGDELADRQLASIHARPRRHGSPRGGPVWIRAANGTGASHEARPATATAGLDIPTRVHGRVRIVAAPHAPDDEARYHGDAIGIRDEPGRGDPGQ
jgi:hypothetical protein